MGTTLERTSAFLLAAAHQSQEKRGNTQEWLSGCLPLNPIVLLPLPHFKGGAKPRSLMATAILLIGFTFPALRGSETERFNSSQPFKRNN